MMGVFTARYIKTESGYMGQLIEIPEVISEGKDLEECRIMLKDAFAELSLAYKEVGKELTSSECLFESLAMVN
jgi:predicted RNase H-like HicB family nuclease